MAIDYSPVLAASMSFSDILTGYEQLITDSKKKIQSEASLKNTAVETIEKNLMNFNEKIKDREQKLTEQNKQTVASIKEKNEELKVILKDYQKSIDEKERESHKLNELLEAFCDLSLEDDPENPEKPLTGQQLLEELKKIKDSETLKKTPGILCKARRKTNEINTEEEEIMAEIGKEIQRISEIPGAADIPEFPKIQNNPGNKEQKENDPLSELEGFFGNENNE